MKPREDGNISDGYTTVEGKGYKRSAKKSHTASLGKVKVSRLNHSGRFETLVQEEEAEIQESTTIRHTDHTGTGSPPESNKESSSEVSTSSSGSSAVESSSQSDSSSAGAAVTPVQTRSSRKRN
jgi:hypothetical protein